VKFGAKLLTVADAANALQLIDANIDQQTQPVTFRLLASSESIAALKQPVKPGALRVGHASSTSQDGQRFWAYLIAAVLLSARVIHVKGRAPFG